MSPLVLIVDDNPDNLNVVGELLEPHYAVRVANGGFRALAMARMLPQPALILLDLMMPDMDGFEVLQALRRDAATADIPVILLTALSSEDDEVRGLQAGADDYITKPLRPAVLLARVAAQLARGADRQALRDARRGLQTALQRAAQSRPTDAAPPHADPSALVPQRPQAPGLAALAGLLQARHPSVEAHRMRMQACLQSLALALGRKPRFAARLGPELGGTLHAHRIGLLLQAAPLHDIGLLAVPDRILDKPAALDAGERAWMQTHTQVGAAALAQAGQAQGAPAWLAWAREIALAHHEHWDGSGYPHGLAGEAIAWPVRLVSLVDAFDGLCSARPHRAAWPLPAARALIASERGRQFDPDVVDCFLDCSGNWPLPPPGHG